MSALGHKASAEAPSPSWISGGRATAELDHGQFEDSFARFLLDERIIDQIVLDRAVSAARKTGDRLDRVLTKLGLLSETNLAVALSKHLVLALGRPTDVPLERILPDIVELDFVRRNRVLPLTLEGGRLCVGVTDPLNPEPVNALAYLTNLVIDVRIFTPADFEKAFDALYAVRADDVGRGSSAGREASELDVQRLRDIASEAPVIRLVNQIIANAVEAHASDIHVEPDVDQVLVRYRIDGMLRTAQTLTPALRAAVTSRIKIMSKLDIAERRMPQDGRIKIAVRGVDIDFRVSTIPTAFGESVVLRILDRSRVELDFAKLGFAADHVTALQGLLSEPNGIILVTGPTGSGKTTTLYTALKSLNSSERKIFSVEDPIEYQLAGINQVQVQAEIGLRFSACAARDPAPGSRHHHDRRNPGSGDGAHCDPVVVDRSSRALDASYQQRGCGNHAVDRYRCRELSAGLDGQGHRGAAAGSKTLSLRNHARQGRALGGGARSRGPEHPGLWRAEHPGSARLQPVRRCRICRPIDDR